MKRALPGLLAVFLTISARAGSHITAGQNFAYGANTGWIDARAGDGTYGMKVGPSVCAGFLWSANTGWINLGDGTPANGIQYANASGTDFGVNRMPDGKLRGLAWSANTGWVNFEDTGNPRVDPSTGQIRGHAWSANTGWIAFDTPDTNLMVTPQDSDGDTIPDSWELAHAPVLTTLGGGDADGDGFSDVEEYAADTDPLDPASRLRITQIDASNPASFGLTWLSRPTRSYRIEGCADLFGWGTAVLVGGAPAFAVPGDAGLTTSRAVLRPPLRGFFRVAALRPPSGE